MKTLYITSEVFPFNKTGGLGDVSAWLPPAIKRAGVDVRYLIPAFPEILGKVSNVEEVADFGARFRARSLRVLKANLKGFNTKFYLVDAPELFGRYGNPYCDSCGNPWGDNWARYAALAWVSAQFSDGSVDNWTPDVIHANDWMCGLAPAYLELIKRKNPRVQTSSVLTIHNLAFQGVYPYEIWRELGLPDYMFNENGVEYWNQVSFLKAGVSFADKITTVSPTYAQEIQTPEYGCGLDGSLVKRRYSLTGILNGVDYDVWNPATDKLIAAQYTKSAMAGKRENKAALQRKCGLAEKADIPLFALVSRLSEQKGIDIFIEALPVLLMNNSQIVVMGTDQGNYHGRLRAIAAQYPEQFAFLDFDESVSHQVIAGADVFMNPAKFEPCGLTQMFAMKYGTVPLARKTGGLCDTIIDATYQNAVVNGIATGFLFENYSLHDFIYCANRVIAAYRGDKKIWDGIKRQGMKQNFSWDNAAAEYIDAYNTQMELG